MAQACRTEGMSDRTTISVSYDLADELHERKSRGESYEKVIWRLIEEADREVNTNE